MTWIALLLSDPSPCLRWLVLTQLLERPTTDPEVRQMAAQRTADPLYRRLADRQAPDGSWGPGDLPGSSHTRILTTAQALMRLGYLGFDPGDPAVTKGAAFLFRQQEADGRWPLPDRARDSSEAEAYDMIPLQTALPLRGLAACGFAADPRAENAYTWLNTQRLDDGAWPTGTSGGSLGYVAGYRRMPHSRWGCRANTTAALCCLALHPTRHKGTVARRALDLLLGRGTQEAANLGFEVARLVGAEPFRGFFTYFARFDPSLLLQLCWRLGASLRDERAARLTAFIQDQQGPYGLWTYAPHPQVSRWVSYDLLQSLANLDQKSGWIGLEPPTPFRPEPYGKQDPRH
jgi:hypothetical protein